ncbi:MAG: hypothetical protein JWL62_1698 [Hyphomicrobiales bacterium]|nr:hypothetical protein [Hyphomicrobiales bacterium]
MNDLAALLSVRELRRDRAETELVRARRNLENHIRTEDDLKAQLELDTNAFYSLRRSVNSCYQERAVSEALVLSNEARLSCAYSAILNGELALTNNQQQVHDAQLHVEEARESFRLLTMRLEALSRAHESLLHLKTIANESEDE